MPNFEIPEVLKKPSLSILEAKAGEKINEENDFLDQCIDRVGTFCSDHELAAKMFFDKNLLPNLDS